MVRHGRFGVVAVGDTPEHAQELYDRVQKVVTEEAREAVKARELPDI